MYSRIVVPLDGSDIAEQALDPALEMAQTMQVPLHLVRVLDVQISDLTPIYGAFTVPVDTGMFAVERDMAVQYLEETARLLEQGGQAVTHELRFGPASAGIVDSLQQGDLLVISSHGRSGMSRWFLGSVAESVIRQSTTPVLLIRALAMKTKRSGTQPTAVTATA